MGHRENRLWQASEGGEKKKKNPQPNKLDMKSVQEENHNLEGEVTTW